MSIQSLLNALEQKVQQLTQAYQTDSDKKINAKFNRTLFFERLFKPKIMGLIEYHSLIFSFLKRGKSWLTR